MLHAAIYYLTTQEVFYGSLLQELSIAYTETLDTLCLSYNIEKGMFQILINPHYFSSLTNEERIAVFFHETLHFTNQHVFRFQGVAEDMQICNIAADMAINQFIRTGLPKGAVDVNEWKYRNGQPFEKWQSMEYYSNLIKNEKNINNKNVRNMLASYTPMDKHCWQTSMTDSEMAKMNQATKDVITRTLEKNTLAASHIPSSVKDLLSSLDTSLASINCRNILKRVLKKTVSAANREPTWKRPNKRYGTYAPGTKMGVVPSLCMYVDTSGSISIREANEFLSIVSQFLKVGVRKCTLCLWHTDIYYKQPYKLHDEVARDVFESGGTDVTCVLEDVVRNKPNLSIVLTDGGYSETTIVPSSEMLWIISAGGDEEHPMCHVGKTMKLESLK